MAADVSPIDVISHIPVQCENKNLPYIYVRSRMELGTAAQTKKPTSVVLLLKPDEKKLQQKFNKIDEKIRKVNVYLA